MKEVLISLFSGIIGVLLTIGYQHFFTPTQSITFIYNGEEMIITETEYTELVKENELLKNELENMQEQINDINKATDMDSLQQTNNSTLLTKLNSFSKSKGVNVNPPLDKTDNYDTVYSSYISGYATVFDTEDPYIEYYVGSEYTNLSGKLYVTRHARGINPQFSNWDIATVSIYGDDSLLYTYTGFSPKDKPLDISINITDVDFLKICFSDTHYYQEGLSHSLISLGNPTITK